MPPKKTKAAAKPKAKTSKRKVDAVKEEEEQEQETNKDASKPTNAKTDTEENNEPPHKAAKTSSPLEWLLSEEAFNMGNPKVAEGHGEAGQPLQSTDHDETEQEKNGDYLRYPQSHLTPFQNLVCASILSKPISHRLGLRTIQTLLNPPFSVRTLKDLDEAGFEGRRKILWEARTQHKERTATLLGDLCEGIKELCGEDEGDLSELKGVKDAIEGVENPAEAQKKVTDTLTQIKGIGPGVAAIFLRRVQGEWAEVFPFIDEKGLKAARTFGLVEEGQKAEELAKKVDGEAAEHREKFVRLVDTLVGLELEKKTEEGLKAAGMA